VSLLLSKLPLGKIAALGVGSASRAHRLNACFFADNHTSHQAEADLA
jgi:hypothetical protein